VQQNGRYCLLAVSQNRTRFLEGSRMGLDERPVHDLPESLQEVVGTEQSEGISLHSFRARSNSGIPAVVHGYVWEDHDEEVDRFFQVIDDAMSKALQQDRRPLIFAGVDEMFAHFRRTTSLANVMDQHISGNPDGLSSNQLHEKAWPIVQSLLHRQVDQAVERWNAAEHSELGGKKLEEIIVAAHDGRIETLLLHEQFHLWGTYDEQSRKATVEEASTASNYDLCDLAAVRTLTANGRVVFLDDGQQLGTDGMAAIYRYAATSA
jgi:Bacterial archaeo-eukaryotic release factor family 3